MRLKEHGSRLRSCGEGWHTRLISLNNIHCGKTLRSMSADAVAVICIIPLSFAEAKSLVCTTLISSAKPVGLMWKTMYKRRSTFFSTPHWSCIGGHTFLLCQSIWWLWNISKVCAQNILGIMWPFFLIAHPYNSLVYGKACS